MVEPPSDIIFRGSDFDLPHIQFRNDHAELEIL
jgi:hypothetical protein